MLEKKRLLLLTHSSLSHYSFGSVLLHRLLGHLGIDPTVEDTQRVKTDGGVVGTEEARSYTTTKII